MLTLLLGKDWVANRDTVLNMIAQEVKQEKSNIILMVPELISHDTERRLCMAAGDTCSRYAEVLSFSRLCRRVSEYTQYGVAQCLDNGGRIVAMASAARQLHSRLKAYACVQTRPEFLSSLVDAVDEFKRCCISSTDLKNAAAMTQGNFAQKLEELSLLLEAYDSLCAQGKRDPRDQIQWLLEQLEESDFANKHLMYIDGFPDFTVQNMQIVQHFILNCPHVVISLNCDQMNSEDPAFEKPGDTAGQILQFAKSHNVPVSIRYIPSENSLHGLCENLFHGSLETLHYSQTQLKVVRADSIFEECICVADHIRQLVQNGTRFRDIGVVCGDCSSYENAIRLIFARCSIPYYLSGKEDILEKSVMFTVFSALEVVLGGFEQNDVLRYLRSPLSPLSLPEADLLENYVFTWNISGKRFLSEWSAHPAGLTDKWSENDRNCLSELNAFRASLITPLYRLSEAFREAGTVREQIVSLYCFLDDISLSARLEQMAQRMEKEGQLRNAQILNQLWDILLDALEQVHDILGDTQWDNDTFIRLLKLLLSQYDVGTIPAVLDSVMVGSIGAMRCQQVEHMIVLGASEGSLPSYGTISGILTDQEREALRVMGVPLTGGAMDGLQTEFSEIYGVFCGARSSVYISCSTEQPSFLYRRLLKISGNELTPAPVLECLCGSPKESAAYLVRRGCNELSDALRLSEYFKKYTDAIQYTLGKVTAETVRALYGHSLMLSASQVDLQADCRLAYFLKYGLHAKERKPATVDPAEYGTYVHAVLEHTVKTVMQQGGFHNITLEQTLQIAHSYSDEYLNSHFGELDSVRLTYLFQRNCLELEMVVVELWEELKESEFVPSYFELAFGNGRDVNAIAIDGKKMKAQLRGFVDRVDVWQGNFGNFFRVVDYKTGKKDFDYCNVFNGLGLQMLLYLFALEQAGSDLVGDRCIAAGVQYFPARAPYLPAEGRLSDAEARVTREKVWKRSGLLLHDEAVLRAMEPGEHFVHLCCTCKKDGTLSGDLANPDQMKMLRSYIFHLLGNMVDEIASGTVTPNPYTRGSSHNACTFCPYGCVCHSESVEGRRNYKMMSAQEFWSEVEKEVNRYG